MKKLSKHTQGLVAINIAAVIFGSAALFGKLDVSPLWIVAARAAFASIALFMIHKVKAPVVLPRRDQFKPLIITGILLTTHWVTFFESVQLAGVANATLTFAAFPLFTVFLENFIQKKRPGSLEIGASIVIIIAVSLIVDVNFTSSDNLLGTFYGFLSALAFTFFGVASKKLGRELSPVRISLYQNMTVVLCLLPFLGFATKIPHGLDEWFWLIMLGIVTTALMHQLYFYALRRLSATTCSGFVALEPVYAISFAAYFFDEPITIWVGISTILIVSASIALLKVEKKMLNN